MATNLRRIMARDGLTFEDVVAATELDERTLRGLVRGAEPIRMPARCISWPRAWAFRIDELFQPVGQAPRGNSIGPPTRWSKTCVAAMLHRFENWSEADFDELYSRFGTGGQLTEAGVLAAAEAMNAKRDLWRQVSVILESGEAELLANFVELLYRRATATCNRTRSSDSRATRLRPSPGTGRRRHGNRFIERLPLRRTARS